MSNVSIEELVAKIRLIEQQKGKFIKQTLLSLERVGDGAVDKETRKIVLDGFNNYTRAIHTVLGYPVER